MDRFRGGLIDLSLFVFISLPCGLIEIQAWHQVLYNRLASHPISVILKFYPIWIHVLCYSSMHAMALEKQMFYSRIMLLRSMLEKHIEESRQ